MAATSHREINATGEATAQGRRYQARYYVICNDKEDGPQTVLDYVEASMPNPIDRSTFAFGNDVDTSAVAVKVSYEGRDRKQDTHHVVAIDFSTDETENGGGIDTNGDPTSDPRDFRPEINSSFMMVNRPVWEALYMSGFTGAMAAVIPDNTKIAVMNSAFDVFDPPLEREIPLQKISVTVNTDAFLNDIALPYIGAVNSLPFELMPMADIGYDGLTWAMKFEKETVRLLDYKPTLRRERIDNEMVDYINIVAELLVDPNGWHDLIPDRGRFRAAKAGDPDGRGGTISMVDLVDGQARLDAIRGPGGDIVPREVLLDGNGQPLANQSADDTVWLKYLKYERKNLAIAPVLLDVFLVS